MKEVRNDAISAVTAIADSTAQESARLLAKHFREADRAADGTTNSYEQACRSPAGEAGFGFWLYK